MTQISLKLQSSQFQSVKCILEKVHLEVAFEGGERDDTEFGSCNQSIACSKWQRFCSCPGSLSRQLPLETLLACDARD